MFDATVLLDGSLVPDCYAVVSVVVVFCCFDDLLRRLTWMERRTDFPNLYLAGGVSIRQSQETLERFHHHGTSLGI